MTNILYETPYEKYRKFGPSALTDAELLAIIIRNGTKHEDALSIASKILASGDGQKRILGLQSLKYEDLLNYPGIGEIKAMCLGSFLELSKRMCMQEREKSILFSDSATVADYYMESLRHLKQENVLLLLLDGKCHLIKEVRLSNGTINSSVFSTRDIFLNAYQYEAVAILLLHNHPSGDPQPSNEDYKVTGHVKGAGELLGIPLIDHIIIGDMCYFSFKAKGYI